MWNSLIIGVYFCRLAQLHDSGLLGRLAGVEFDGLVLSVEFLGRFGSF
jgi:hypothetical protein